MENWKADYKKLTGKAYWLLLSLVAVAGYGFKICHPAIGIDDTPYAYYFEEGLSAIVGRWVMFLLNKVVHIGEFAPFITDFAAVLILMAAVTVWMLLFYRILGDRLSKCGYYFFACIFLSCPLISEVFTYFLHNGIAVGYLCSGISLCLLREALRGMQGQSGDGTKDSRKKTVGLLLGCAGLLVVAMGCYESFMVVWLAGLMLMLLAERFAGEHNAGAKNPVIRKLCLAALCAVVAMVVRSLMIAAVTGVFHLQYLKDDAVQRSLFEMAKWLFGADAGAEFAMVLKRSYVMYVVFACAYYPIKIFLLAAVVIVIYSIWSGIRRRDFWAPLLMLGTFVACFLLIFLEGKATLYRSAQFLPLLCGFGALVFVLAVTELRKWVTDWKNKRAGNICSKGVGACAALILAVILWNQCADLNKWFYVDYGKYEYSRELVHQIAYQLKAGFDLSKPVVFTGEWDCPKSIIADAYVDYGTKEFYKMKRLTDPIDEHLLEKFYRNYGVWVAQTPSLTVIGWGRNAFGGTEEMVHFFAMHGYELQPMHDEEVYDQMELYSIGLPNFPQEGSIVDVGDYIIVHF